MLQRMRAGSVGLLVVLVGTAASAAGYSPPVAKRVTVTPANFVGGKAAHGTVSLTRVAPAEGARCRVWSTSSAALPPALIRVRSGRTSAQFLLATHPVVRDVTGWIRARCGPPGSPVRGARIVVRAPSLATLVVPKVMRGGDRVSGTVTLNGKAGPEGVEVLLSSSPEVGTPDGTLVEPGETTGGFGISPDQVTSAVRGEIVASAGGTRRVARFTIRP